jgi:hypothetical protein
MDDQSVSKKEYEAVRRLAVLLAAEMRTANGLIRPACQQFQRKCGYMGDFPQVHTTVWCEKAREWLKSYIDLEAALSELKDPSPPKEGP